MTTCPDCNGRGWIRVAYAQGRRIRWACHCVLGQAFEAQVTETNARLAWAEQTSSKPVPLRRAREAM